MKMPANGPGATITTPNPAEGGEKHNIINPELWQACAGPLVNLPAAGTHVVYFPQGHSEQVAASMKKDVDAQIPNYPNLQSKLLCILHNVTLHADPETDEVYAQMTLQPVPSFDKEALLRSDLLMKTHKPQTEFFCKTLTASDTSTHGGFSVPRRAAEKIFPPLDFKMQPPAQELVARDLHDNVWTFRHIYRGQPKRHLLTTGWSLFVSGKRLFAGDSVLFIRDEKQHLLLGIRRANRQPTNLSSSVLSSDSMHIGILAAAAHAAANNSPFTVFYNPRASPSEFVIPLAKYYKAVCSNQISLGMRFRMMFETEESGTRRYMGTITGISDLDPVRWKNSQWRNLQVGWDESTAGERRNRVSIWEIEPVTAPFFICPTPTFYPSKRPRQPGMPGDESADLDNLLKRTMPWLGEDMSMKDPGLSLVQWMNMQQNSSLANSIPPGYLNTLPGPVLQNYGVPDLSRQLGLTAPQILNQSNLQFNSQRSTAQLDQLQKLPQPTTTNQLAMMMQPQMQPQQQLIDLSQQQVMRQNQPLIQSQNVAQQQLSIQNHELNRNLQQQQQQPPPPQMAVVSQSQQISQKLHPENQIQLLQKLHQQQQPLFAHQPSQNSQQLQDQQKPLIDVSQTFSRSMSTSVDIPPQTPVISHPQQMPRTNSNVSIRFSNLSQQPKLHHHQHELSNQLSTNGSSLLTGTAGGGGQSVISDDVPSCSTSPSTNNCSNFVSSMMLQNSTHLADHSGGVETASVNVNFAKDMHQRADVKPTVNISKNQNQGFLTPQTYLNHLAGTQTDYLDSSSSATSVCLSQNEAHFQNQNSTFNSQPMAFRDTIQDGEVQDIPFRANVNHRLGMPSVVPDPLIEKGMMSSYSNPAKETQPELSSSMVSQSFGVPDMTFNSIDSTINDGSLLDNGVWAPPPPPPPQQFQRLRTFTKVYKRGAVGRSIDITAYSGYEELKQDLARRFGIEGQLEDRQRIGWKLVYVDHENDVLLVGDDPWEEFVNCVRCIKILSPQEVQQMSLDGDFGGNSVLSNQACSSSDGGNV